MFEEDRSQGNKAPERFRVLSLFIGAAALTAIIGCAADSGPAACEAAGGKCVFGGSSCAKAGSQDCNPNRNPGGAFCCLDQPVACTDANVQIVKASNYDQTCKTNADCVAVGEGNACYACAIACTSAAINTSAKPRYAADVAKTPAGRQAGSVSCGCPAEFGPCCIGGLCHADNQCSPPTP